MANIIFNLTENRDYITLDKLLKLTQQVGSGGEAHAVIGEGLVKVNGEVELQKRKKLRAGDKAEFRNEYIEVVG